MLIDNYTIAEQFSQLAKIMDIHGENAFKTKSYSSAAFTIEKLPSPLTDMAPESIFAIRGIGDAIGKKIQEIIAKGELSLLRQYINNTPPGIIDMLGIKGLGPKKIATIWKEMDIESIGELLYACQENRLMLYKGFGEKTQNNVKDAIEFYFRSQGSHLYADLENYAQKVNDQLQKNFPGQPLSLTGEFRRQLEVIDELQWVTTIAPEALRQFLESQGFAAVSPSGVSEIPATFAYKGPEGVRLEFFCTDAARHANSLLETSCSPEFLESWRERTPEKLEPTEEQLFAAAGIPFVPPCLREDPAVLEWGLKDAVGGTAAVGGTEAVMGTAAAAAAAAAGPTGALIQPGDIRAIIHSHSNWSDGSNTLEEMAAACIARGHEYLVISDHSKSAFYANGLSEERIKAQHAQIEELNAKLAPFTIFKSIECDILNDGTLDYSETILSTFDLVIASIHSNLKMTEDKAMTRLLNAISNPYTSILGHMTGRLLLSRPGYPVDHKRIIDACAEHHTVIELNAHPRRLDMDWRWIGYALEKGVLISVDPDAHSTEGFDHTRYGVLVAQKGGLTAARNLSSFTLEQFVAFLAERKALQGRS